MNRTWPQSDPGVMVQPDPAIEGGDVEVSYSGPGPLMVSVDGGPWQELPLDDAGRGTFTVPGGVRGLSFSDLHRPVPTEAFVEVQSTGAQR